MIFDKLRRLTDYERKIIANVRGHGCHITSVASADDEEWEPPFSYSTGFLETVNQPEVIVLGLPGTLCGAMVNDLLRMCREGLALADGAEIEGLLQGHRVIARAIDPSRIVHEYFNSAIWYEERRTGRALDRAVQLVWPGAVDGLFPWDEDCSQEDVYKRQGFPHVVWAYTIGEAGEMFARLLEGEMPVERSGTLEAAVQSAAARAKEGETVLLSPACASFDQFTDYEARGQAFRDAVEALG